MQFISITNALLTIVAALVGLAIWMVKRNTDKVSAAALDIAVIKTTIKNVDKDHDTLVILEYKQGVSTRDINAAHGKIREITTDH